MLLVGGVVRLWKAEDGRLKNVGGLGRGVDNGQVNLVPSALDARSSSELIDVGEGNV